MQNVKMNKLKRPMTGYMMFCKKMRDKIKATGQDFTVKETMKTIGREWSKLSVEEKTRYDLLAGDDRAKLN
jgi:protoporphyrinogen oxidase